MSHLQQLHRSGFIIIHLASLPQKCIFNPAFNKIKKIHWVPQLSCQSWWNKETQKSPVWDYRNAGSSCQPSRCYNACLSNQKKNKEAFLHQVWEIWLVWFECDGQRACPMTFQVWPSLFTNPVCRFWSASLGTTEGAVPSPLAFNCSVSCSSSQKTASKGQGEETRTMFTCTAVENKESPERTFNSTDEAYSPDIQLTDLKWGSWKDPWNSTYM